MPFNFRKAETADIKQIVDLIAEHARNDEILPRDESNISKNIDEFSVVLDESGVIGTAAIQVYTADLAEIRSLIIKDKYQRQGLGREIVTFVEQRLKDRGIKYSFVLTRSVQFFQSLHYNIVNKSLFPEKIWNDCSKCPHINACDEIAMQKTL